ncbi:MAG TPA: alpha/beta hydrolase [Frankiaceae bacterium]|nr:alpha/beta hydrolase [Frankiaceae bacterium]
MRRRPTRRGAGLLGAAVGALAAGVATGVAVERLVVGRDRLKPDPEASEPFGRLPGRASAVTLPDGVRLHVEETGDGPLTVVFVHGFALSMASWHYQRRDLADVGRLVFYDQRAHGMSARGDDRANTLKQLGHDLAYVVERLAPRGPVVLVGHSMGGMTVMSLAQERPDLIGTRVVAAALLATSAGGIAEAVVPIPARAADVLASRLLPRVHRVAGSPLVGRTRRAGSDLNFLFTKVWGFGDDPSPAQVELCERMTSATPLDVITSFLPTFVEHDLYRGLAELARIPTLVIGGTKDKVTPYSHSEEMARRIPGTQFVTLAGAGHMLMFERAPLVNLHLRAFLRRAARTSSAAKGA